MSTEPLYIEAVHPGAYRPQGQTMALVVGAVWASPGNGLEARACFSVLYPEGEADLVPVVEVNGKSYRFTQESEG